jgi:ferritin
MLNKKMEEAFNAQINREMFSGYLYMAMSARCTDLAMDGFARWFMIQFHEEMFHAMKMYQYIHDQGGKVSLAAIEAPKFKGDTVKDLVEATLKHEQSVTRFIWELAGLAQKEGDLASQQFLQWYIKEQVEEEKNPLDMLNKLAYIKEGSSGLLYLDHEIGHRKLGVPSDFSGGVGEGD